MRKGSVSIMSFMQILVMCVVVGVIFVIAIRIEHGKNEKKTEVNFDIKLEIQEKQWANDVKKIAFESVRTCKYNYHSISSLISTNYQANTQMNEIINILTQMAEQQGEVDALALELHEQGGDM